MQDGGHLFGDGHFDVVGTRQAEGGGGGADALRYFAVQVGENLRQLAALAQFDADHAVARERAGAGEHQIAQAGESGKRFCLAAAGHGEARNLGDAPGDEASSGVVPKAQAGDDTGGDGNDVLERAAEFDADDVVIGVEAECRARELPLEVVGHVCAGAGDGDGGGHACGHLLREGWATENGDRYCDGCGHSPDSLGDHLAHAEVRGVFDTLGGADEDVIRTEQRGQRQDGGAQVLRRRDAEQDIRSGDGGLQVRGDVDAGGDRHTGQIRRVLSVGTDGFSNAMRVGP